MFFGILYILLVYTDKKHCFKSGNSPRMGEAKLNSSFYQPFDLHDIRLTQERGVVGKNVYDKEHALACGRPGTFTSTTIFKDVVENVARKDGIATS